MRQLVVAVLFFIFLACGKDQTADVASLPDAVVPDLKKTEVGLPSQATASSSSPSTEQSKKTNINWVLSLLDEPVDVFLYTNKPQITIILPELRGIKSVEVSSSCHMLSGEVKTYPYATTTDVDFGGRNKTIYLAVRLVLDDKSRTDCKTKMFVHDDKSPTGFNFKINEGRKFTNSNQVTLSFFNLDDEVYVTNIPNCSAGGTWKKTSWATPNIDWIVSPGVTTTIYAKFRDLAKNESECLSASITHDNQPPEGSISINNGQTSTAVSTATVNIFSPDAVQMIVSETSSGCSQGTNWRTYSNYTSVVLPSTNDGFVEIYAKFIDEAGNVSTCTSDSIATPPVTLTYQWYEGVYYPKYTACGFNSVIDRTTYRTKTVSYPAFTVLSGNSYSCSLSGSGTKYYCDYTGSDSNCGTINSFMCNGYLSSRSYPGGLDCRTPTSF